MPPSQGFTYLCGCFAATIATSKAVNSIKKLSTSYQREMLEAIYTDLDAHNELLQVLKKGSIRPQILSYLRCLQQKLKTDFDININISLPLLKHKNLTQADVLDFIREQSSLPRTSVLFGLTGIHDHWTTAKIVKQKNILLLDSDYLKRLPLRNFPNKHQISKNDVFVIRAEPPMNKNIKTYSSTV